MDSNADMTMPKLLRKNQETIEIIIREIQQAERKEIGLSDFLYKYRINSKTVRHNVELHNELSAFYNENFGTKIPKILIDDTASRNVLTLEKN